MLLNIVMITYFYAVFRVLYPTLFLGVYDAVAPLRFHPELGC